MVRDSIIRPVGLGLLALTLVIGGCGGDDEDGPAATATATEEATATTTEEATATTTEEATSTEEMTPAAGGEAQAGNVEDLPYATVDLASIEGAEERTEAEEGPPRGYSFTWFELADAPFVGAAVRAEMDAIRADFEEELGTPVPDSPVSQDVTITAQLVAISDDVIGVRLEILEFFGANAGMLSRTLWFDRATEEQFDATALLAGPEALDALAALSREALERDLPDLGTDMIEPGTEATAELFDGIAFTAEGDLLVEFDEGQVGPTAAGTPRVVVPADAAAPLLSEFGQRAQEAVTAAP